MKAGVLLRIIRDIINLLDAQGVILADGSFDTATLSTITEDVAFGVKVEGVLKKNGVDIPDKVDKIIALLPLIAGMLE